MSATSLHIAGRYNKYQRNLSQSPWIDKNDVRVKDSVVEMIEAGMRRFLKYKDSSFTSSGREDVDVRMLGKGRPFAFKITHPEDVETWNLKDVQDYINTQYAGRIRVHDLQLTDKKNVMKNMQDCQDTKRKQYRALCCCTRSITHNDIENISKLTELCLKQKTPIRVMHRRTIAVRQRSVYNLKIEPVKVGDFESVHKGNLDRVFCLSMSTEAGTYIKEFVHGDFGRTKPSLSSLLGDCDTDLMELDVMEVESDWPPSVDDSSSSCKNQILPISQMDKLESSEEALIELYKKAYDLMQKALDSPRGDAREDHLIQSRKLFERAINIVDSLALYSENETLEDVATSNLRYMLIPAFLAKISISGELNSRRFESYSKAATHLGQFFHRVSSYGLSDDRLDQALECISQGSQTSHQRLMGNMTLEEQVLSRAEKIERFKKTKKLEQKLTELHVKMNSDNEVDDDVARDYHISFLKKWINETLEDYERIIRPGLMFERKVIETQGDKSQSSTKPEEHSRPQSETFTIVKDQLQKRAFGVGYPSLPTVTVDDFITKKIKDGDLAFHSQKQIYANSLQRYAEQPDLRRQQEEQSDEEREAKEERDNQEELDRKRAWDEFKDETPRGSGNRHNMG